MKEFSAKFLFQIYLWCVLLIPALHQGGYVCPHGHENGICLKTSSELAAVEASGGNKTEDGSPCPICQVATTLLDRPESGAWTVPSSVPDTIENMSFVNPPTFRLITGDSRAPPDSTY